jgi:hypothetical protein
VLTRSNCPYTISACNILLEGTADVYTLFNYRKHINCSLTTLYPACVKVLSLNVDLQDVQEETDTVNKVRYILMLTGRDCSSNSIVLNVDKGEHILSHTDPELMS